MSRGYQTAFIGRIEELGLLRSWLLGPSRLASLVSPGGFGKTRLVDRLLAEQADLKAVVVWQDDGVESAGLVAALVAALEIGDPGTGGGSSLELAIANALTRRGIRLLVLDGVESRPEEARQLISVLLQKNPDLKVLVTSRVRVGVEAEQWIELAPLRIDADGGVSDATALLLARCADYGVCLTGVDEQVLDDIASQVHGVPLAIEMVAARLRVVEPRLLSRLLNDGPGALGHQHTSQSPRHRSLVEVIGWSLGQLKGESKRGICALSVFSGSFTLEIAAILLERSLTATVEIIEDLLRMGMMQRLASPGAISRFSLYGVVREQSRAMLSPEERRTVELRLITALLSAAEEPMIPATKFHELYFMWPELLRICDEGFDGIQFDDRLRAVILLCEAAYRFGGRALLAERLEAMLEDDSLQSAPIALQARARISWMRCAASLRRPVDSRKELDLLAQMSLPESLALHVEILEIGTAPVAAAARRFGDLFNDARCLKYPRVRLLVGLALVPALLMSEQTERAIATGEAVAILARELGEWGREAWTLITRATALADVGRLDQAQLLLDEAQPLIRSHQLSPRYQAHISYCSALICLHTAHVGEVLEHVREGRQLFFALDDTNHGVALAAMAAAAHCMAGEWVAAELASKELVASSVGELRVTGFGLIAVAHAGQGDFDRCCAALRDADGVERLGKVFIRARDIYSLVGKLEEADGAEQVCEELAALEPVLSRPCRLAKSAVERLVRARMRLPGDFRLLSQSGVAELPCGETVSLHTRPMLLALVVALTRQHVYWPGTPIPDGELMAQLWPEKASLDSKQNRLRVAVTKIRKALPGLKIEHRDGGYLLSESVSAVLEQFVELPPSATLPLEDCEETPTEIPRKYHPASAR